MYAMIDTKEGRSVKIPPPNSNYLLTFEQNCIHSTAHRFIISPNEGCHILFSSIIHSNHHCLILSKSYSTNFKTLFLAKESPLLSTTT